MENLENDMQPFFLHVEPILPVKSITETVSYWHNVLGFPGKWTWGNPIDYGGVSWHDVSVQFSLDPELATVSVGNAIWIKIRNIQALYDFHKKGKAEIVMPLENKPWGMSQYTVREINGYYLNFASSVTERTGSETKLPDTIRILSRIPTISEYRNLITAVGWSTSASDEVIKMQLSTLLYAVVAEDTLTGEAVGCALLVGDHFSFYYVKDVMVHPLFQKKRVGTALMQKLAHWLDTNGADGTLAGLFTGENLGNFYKQAGFSNAFGMTKMINR